jgi:hypothetical protein
MEAHVVTTRRSALLTVAVLLVPLSARAQSRAREPAQAAAQFFDDVERGAWDSAAAMVDTETARANRTETLQSLVWIAAHGAELLQQQDSGGFGRAELQVIGSPNEVDTAALRRHADFALPSFPGSPTIGALAALSPRALMARVFEASVHPVVPPALHEHAEAPAEFWRKPRVIGAVVEIAGVDTVAHVLYREQWPVDSSDTADSASEWKRAYTSMRWEAQELLLVRRSGEWRVVPPIELTTAASTYMFMYFVRESPSRER